jgi:hypothetical protein
MSLTLYIIYNNSTSFLGKIGYNFRRMSATAESPACAASDLTHGGDVDHEKPEWIQLKKQIPASIEQLHYDKIPADVRQPPTLTSVICTMC